MNRKILNAIILIPFLALSGELFSASESSEKREVRIPWKKVPEATGYEFEINGDLHEVKDSFILLNLKIGQYKFRLRSVDPAGAKSVWSNWQNFEIHPRFNFSDNSGTSENINRIPSSKSAMNSPKKKNLISAEPLVESGNWEGKVPEYDDLEDLFSTPRVDLDQYIVVEKKSYKIRR
jgi:hypothetical protein